MQEFNKKFKIENYLIQDVGGWKISLRPQQPTIGSLILSLSRKCSSFAELTTQESIDLGIAFKKIEKMLKKAFQPQKINYLALMMVDNQVHYHVLPRYENVIEINDKAFSDKCWPVAHDLKPLTELDGNDLLMLYKKLKEMV